MMYGQNVEPTFFGQYIFFHYCARRVTGSIPASDKYYNDPETLVLSLSVSVRVSWIFVKPQHKDQISECWKSR